jgi:nucleotide-binding universal stress UspA family protein
MVPPIVVGAHPKRYEPEPVALGLMLSRLTRAPSHVVGTFWFDSTPQRTATQEYGRILKDRVREAQARLGGGDLDDPPPDTAFHLDYGPDKYVLHQVATRVGAGLIVVGLTRRGLGRMVPGMTPAGVVRGAPCPVAVAPRGMPEVPAIPTRVGVLALPPRACVTLRAAAGIARLSGGGLIAYMDPDRTEAVEQAIAEDAADVEVETRVLPQGGVVGTLVRESRGLDMLVGGSRVPGLRGTLTGRLACPLVVVPDGVERPFMELLGAHATRAASRPHLPALVDGAGRGVAAASG